MKKKKKKWKGKGKKWELDIYFSQYSFLKHLTERATVG